MNKQTKSFKNDDYDHDDKRAVFLLHRPKLEYTNQKFHKIKTKGFFWPDDDADYYDDKISYFQVDDYNEFDEKAAILLHPKLEYTNKKLWNGSK